MMPSYSVLHSTPGRVRLSIPEIVGSPTRARACEDAVQSLPGVQRAQASDRTGNLLVHYLPTAVQIDQIREQCAQCAHQGWPCSHHSVPATARRGHTHGGSVALSLAMEILPHVLPLVLKTRLC